MVPPHFIHHKGEELGKVKQPIRICAGISQPLSDCNNDGALKWVLSRGGRSYKVGDFKQVDGKLGLWLMSLPNHDEIMNFVVRIPMLP